MMDLASILKKTPPHSTVSVPPGEYEGGLTLRVSGVTLRAAPGTVTIRGGARFGLKIDGAADTTLDGLRFVGSGGHGVFAVNAHNLSLLDVTSDDHAVNGILTGNCLGVSISRSRARRNKAGHNCYLSEAGGRYRLFDNDFSGGAGRCACQINAHPGGPARDVQIARNNLQGATNACLQLAAVVGGTIAGNQVGGARQDVSLWDDTAGKHYACSDLDLVNQDGVIHVHPLCRNIRTKPGAAVAWSG